MKVLYEFSKKKITDGNYDHSLAVKCINGTFAGKKAENIISYKGIPFVGQQPVGNLRWKAPVDVTPSNDVYEAYNYAKAPVQAPGDPAVENGMSEDCLYLNLWKSDDATAEKKPVIVWIYGGGYEVGGTTDPQYDCTNLVKENPEVIVVTIAYRLSFLGFLHLSHLSDGKDYPDAQNLGLMNQLMALKWIHENIAGLGGDPDNVTIWGESAGSGSCSLLPLVSGSHKYFKRVIAQSGAPAQTRSAEQAIEITDNFMEALGCKTVRKMWIQFAKTGNPSLTAEQSPTGKAIEWPLYDTGDKQVMVLDESNIHTAKESELKIVDWERTYFLTNTYFN